MCLVFLCVLKKNYGLGVMKKHLNVGEITTLSITHSIKNPEGMEFR
jgi:hypothetical protein